MKYFDVPTQVFWKNPDFGDTDSIYDSETEYFVGIAYKDEIICACCGAVYDVDEVVSNAIEDGREAIRMFGTWVDISTEVEGDLDDYENHTVLLELEDK
jgi:hypothetical protein